MKMLPTLVGLMAISYFAACSDNGSSAEAFNAAKVCPESGRGTFVDERDGQEYRYTTIGNQVWMAQNLNYDITEETLPDPLTGEQADVRFTCLYPDDNCMEKGLVYRSPLKIHQTSRKSTPWSTFLSFSGRQRAPSPSIPVLSDRFRPFRGVRYADRTQSSRRFSLSSVARREKL